MNIEPEDLNPFHIARQQLDRAIQLLPHFEKSSEMTVASKDRAASPRALLQGPPPEIPPEPPPEYPPLPPESEPKQPPEIPSEPSPEIPSEPSPDSPSEPSPDSPSEPSPDSPDVPPDRPRTMRRNRTNV